jgi:hypothetical protein
MERDDVAAPCSLCLNHTALHLYARHPKDGYALFFFAAPALAEECLGMM